MATINGKSFTQYTDLNILDELRVQGVLISPSGGQDIVEVSGNYSQEIDDDVIVITGPANLTLIQASTAVKSVSVKSKLGGGDVVLLPFAGDTVNATTSVTLTNGTANKFTPITLDWEITA